MINHHTTATIRGVATAVHARPNRTWSRGRTCQQPGCGTALSIYNRSTMCAVHEEVRPYIHRGTRRSKRSADRAA